jgi:hypothetical protein
MSQDRRDTYLNERIRRKANFGNIELQISSVETRFEDIQEDA